MAAPKPPPAAAAALGAAGTVFFGSLCAGTGALGVWQTRRYFDKQALVEQRATDLRLPPLPYAQFCRTAAAALAEQQQQQQQNSSVIAHLYSAAVAPSAAAATTADAASAVSFRRIQLTGRYLHDREFLVGPRGPPAGALPDGPGRSASGLAASPQGYFVLTPLVLAADDDNNQSSDNVKNKFNTYYRSKVAVESEEKATAPILLVNRGWVPLHLVPRQQHQRGPPSTPSPLARGREGGTPTTTTAVGGGRAAIESPLPLLHWNRPAGTVRVTVVPAKAEEPKYLVAEHNFATHPAVLYWYDMPAMLAVADIPNPPQPPPPLLLVTQVHDDDDPAPAAADADAAAWPVQPPADRVGEFKVSPAVHVGYAATWYGLCAAGLYMMRTLVTRGR